MSRVQIAQYEAESFVKCGIKVHYRWTEDRYLDVRVDRWALIFWEEFTPYLRNAPDGDRNVINNGLIRFVQRMQADEAFAQATTTLLVLLLEACAQPGASSAEFSKFAFDLMFSGFELHCCCGADIETFDWFHFDRSSCRQGAHLHEQVSERPVVHDNVREE